LSGENADKGMMTKRREMNDKRVERVLDMGTSVLSTNQAIRILRALVMIRGCTLWLRKGMTRKSLHTPLL
jgi:hypothetical protein